MIYARGTDIWTSSVGVESKHQECSKNQGSSHRLFNPILKTNGSKPGMIWVKGN
jgi:hypothetical protein